MSDTSRSTGRDRGESAVRPQLGPAEMVLLLWRAKWLMLAVFLPIFAAGLAFALVMPTSYSASSRLLATLDDFYVYRPLAGVEAAGATLEQEQVIQAELELLRSPVVAERALRRFPLERVYPGIARARDKELAGAPDIEHPAIAAEALQEGVEALMDDLDVFAAPKTPVINTVFKHKDAETAAEILNAVIGSYLGYRTELLTSETPDSFAGQRKAFEAQLLDAEKDIRDFLAAHAISDFGAERETVQALLPTVRGDLLEAEARLQAVEGQIAGLREQLAAAPAEANIFVEDSTEQVLLDLKLEREDLLSRYTPHSRPVQAIERRIAQAEAYLAGQSGPVGTVRRGPNPVYQDLQRQLAGLQGDVRSLTEQRAELQRQLSGLEARLADLTALAPRWSALQRARRLAEDGVMDYATRESQSRARSELARQSVENIRVLEPARPPVRGSSLALPVAALAFLFAGFTALMTGLAWAVTRPGLPTARSLERTLGVPVIASVRERR